MNPNPTTDEIWKQMNPPLPPPSSRITKTKKKSKSLLSTSSNESKESKARVKSEVEFQLKCLNVTPSSSDVRDLKKKVRPPSSTTSINTDLDALDDDENEDVITPQQDLEGLAQWVKESAVNSGRIGGIGGNDSDDDSDSDENDEENDLNVRPDFDFKVLQITEPADSTPITSATNVTNIPTSPSLSPQRKWTITTFQTSLTSPLQTTRISSLTTLSTLLHALKATASLPSLPSLTFPPPYDTSRIVLTHKTGQGALVSDMASGKYAKSWGVWERSQKGLMEQFLEDKNTLGGSRSGNGGGVNDGDSGGLLKADDALQNEATLKIQHLLTGLSSSLFKLLTDPIERVRSLTLTCITLLLSYSHDISLVLPYLIPVIKSRYIECYFDNEHGVFIHDLDAHEKHKRGVAIERQDRVNIVHGLHKIDVIETSEEVRLDLCRLISTLLQSCLAHGTLHVLNPYFTDILLILQSQLRDPYPTLKTEASELLTQVLRVPQWELGACMFALAVARASIPNIRHRSAKVRIATLSLFEASVSVPNRAKVRGAGTDAIADLVGFREDNVLPVAAFYSSSAGVSVNALAEVSQDSNGTVRAKACEVLCFLVCCLPDRYDHHTRLLPYLLSFYNDEDDRVRAMARDAVEFCGEQYESEHPEEVIERRQYGVDGDKRTNLPSLSADGKSDSSGGSVSVKLPEPFLHRPRLGARLFIRGNTKRFFSALLKELSNWISTTRLRSVQLLTTLVVYCEEHLTMDFAATLTLTVKAITSSLRLCTDGDTPEHTNLANLCTVFELYGRYVDPETYLPLLLPRVTGKDVDTGFSEGGSTLEVQSVHAIALLHMVRGSLGRRVGPFFGRIGVALCQSASLECGVGGEVRVRVLECLVEVVRKVSGSGMGLTLGRVDEGFYEKGRLSAYDNANANGGSGGSGESIWRMIIEKFIVNYTIGNANHGDDNRKPSESQSKLRSLALTGLSIIQTSNNMNMNMTKHISAILNNATERIKEEGWCMLERVCDDIYVLEFIWSSHFSVTTNADDSADDSDGKQSVIKKILIPEIYMNENMSENKNTAFMDLLEFGKWVVKGVIDDEYETVDVGYDILNVVLRMVEFGVARVNELRIAEGEGEGQSQCQSQSESIEEIEARIERELDMILPDYETALAMQSSDQHSHSHSSSQKDEDGGESFKTQQQMFAIRNSEFNIILSSILHLTPSTTPVTVNKINKITSEKKPNTNTNTRSQSQYMRTILTLTATLRVYCLDHPHPHPSESLVNLGVVKDSLDNVIHVIMKAWGVTMTGFDEIYDANVDVNNFVDDKVDNINKARAKAKANYYNMNTNTNALNTKRQLQNDKRSILKLVGMVLDCVRLGLNGGVFARILSFAKRKRTDVDVGDGDDVISVKRKVHRLFKVITDSIDSFNSFNGGDRVACWEELGVVGDVCEGFVYFLNRGDEDDDEHEGGGGDLDIGDAESVVDGVSAGASVSVSEVGKSGKDDGKTIKVNIEMSESSSDEEEGEGEDKKEDGNNEDDHLFGNDDIDLEEVSTATQNTEIEIEDEDEAKTTTTVISYRKYLQLILPLCYHPVFRNGLDNLHQTYESALDSDEDECERERERDITNAASYVSSSSSSSSSSVLTSTLSKAKAKAKAKALLVKNQYSTACKIDSALRLAAVLDPGVFVEEVVNASISAGVSVDSCGGGSGSESDGRDRRCVFYDHLEDHGGMIVMFTK